MCDRRPISSAARLAMRLCNSLLLILSSATGFSSGALYAGSYTCGTPAWLFLHVDEASDERVTAVFHFLYPSSTQNGAYQIRGKYRDAPLPMRRAVQFEPGHWVVTAGLDPRNAARVLAKTAKPAAGTYLGTWSIVADDGHKETGKFRFTVKN